MSYLRWSSSPFYVYWMALPGGKELPRENQELVIHGMGGESVRLSYGALKDLSFNKVLINTLDKFKSTRYRADDITALRKAIEDFMKDVEERH